ncbi:MAG: DUF484 family protein [Pseudomonadota bacterium]
MTSTPKIEDALRQAILSQPDAVLDDKDVMHALIAANEKIMGANIVDLRGIAMDRLETRLDRLEDTHRSVIAAAYENLAGTNQIHRAVLRLLEPLDVQDFLQELNGEIAELLRVDVIRLVLEAGQVDALHKLPDLDGVLRIEAPGYVHDYITHGRSGSARHVTLRQIQDGDEALYGEPASWVRSEACLKLDLGDDRLPGMLVMGAEDPHMFGPQQGTDLLGFFAGVCERTLRHLLS